MLCLVWFAFTFLGWKTQDKRMKEAAAGFEWPDNFPSPVVYQLKTDWIKWIALSLIAIFGVVYIVIIVDAAYLACRKS